MTLLKAGYDYTESLKLLACTTCSLTFVCLVRDCPNKKQARY